MKEIWMSEENSKASVQKRVKWKGKIFKVLIFIWVSKIWIWTGARIRKGVLLFGGNFVIWEDVSIFDNVSAKVKSSSGKAITVIKYEQ